MQCNYVNVMLNIALSLANSNYANQLFLTPARISKMKNPGLKVLSDARHVLFALNAYVSELISRSESREQEHLRRVDRSRAQNHFGGENLPEHLIRFATSVIGGDFDAGALEIVVDHAAVGDGRGQNVEIVARRVRRHEIAKIFGATRGREPVKRCVGVLTKAFAIKPIEVFVLFAS